jgi:hypothetical protein
MRYNTNGLDAYTNTNEGAPILFSTGGSERMRITSGGNVLIGTTTVGTSKLTISSPNDQAGVYMINTFSGNAWSFRTGTPGISNTGLCIYDETNSRNTIQITSGGNILMGTTTDSAGVRLKVVGGIIGCLDVYNNTTGVAANMQIDSNGFFSRSTVSSLRYKENIKDWDGNGLDTILALNPKTFKYKKDYYNKADIDFLGLIAEDVAKVSPYLADYENEDRTGQVENVRYAFIVVPLIKAIQELKQELDTLKNK